MISYSFLVLGLTPAKQGHSICKLGKWITHNQSKVWLMPGAFLWKCMVKCDIKIPSLTHYCRTSFLNGGIAEEENLFITTSLTSPPTAVPSEHSSRKDSDFAKCLKQGISKAAHRNQSFWTILSPLVLCPSVCSPWQLQQSPSSLQPITVCPHHHFTYNRLSPCHQLVERDWSMEAVGKPTCFLQSYEVPWPGVRILLSQDIPFSIRKARSVETITEKGLFPLLSARSFKVDFCCVSTIRSSLMAATKGK